MTRGSVVEYAAAIRGRYGLANREEKGRILDEFVKITGYHRKAAIRMLLNVPRESRGHRGRHSRYHSVIQPLKSIWEASDRLCSKRLQPFLPEMVKVLRRQGAERIDPSQEELLCQMSPATIDRMLRSCRQAGGRRSLSVTRPGNLLKNSIPIRTFADWVENKPGFLEIDLVAHCAESLEGFYLNTLCAVDVASGWTECVPVWGKGQMRVKSSVHRVRQRLPTFTRSRAYKKNDSCHVEQKNGNVVRRLVGYDRYSSKAACQCLERIYGLVRLYMNFFQPTMKLLTKTRHGAKVRKVYDTARTPYQRLLQSGVITDAKKTELSATYHLLNPAQLLKQINGNLEQLWRLAERQGSLGNRNYEAKKEPSVTV